MTTSAILLCGGRGDRWNDHRGITKHMAPVGPEPLVVRTCRQLRTRLGVEPWVVARDPRLLALGLRNFTDYDARFCSAGALSTLPLWADRTFLLFGDTYFDRATMNDCCAAKGVRAFWSQDQFFGWHWDSPEGRERVEKFIRQAVAESEREPHDETARGMGYLNHSYYLMAGFPPCGVRHRKDSPLVHEALGTCMDFDYPSVYASFLKHQRPDDLP